MKIEWVNSIRVLIKALSIKGLCIKGILIKGFWHTVRHQFPLVTSRIINVCHYHWRDRGVGIISYFKELQVWSEKTYDWDPCNGCVASGKSLNLSETQSHYWKIRIMRPTLSCENKKKHKTLLFNTHQSTILLSRLCFLVGQSRAGVGGRGGQTT